MNIIVAALIVILMVCLLACLKVASDTDDQFEQLMRLKAKENTEDDGHMV